VFTAEQHVRLNTSWCAVSVGSHSRSFIVPLSLSGCPQESRVVVWW